MGITITTLHNWWTGEFEKPTTVEIINSTPYRLQLLTSNYTRGQVMSNRGKALDKLPARQGVPWTLIRLRGDRTGEEQPYWLKTTDPVALYVTLCYGLYQGGVDSGWKLTLKVFRPENGEPRLHARLTEHHSAEQTINMITEEHNEETGKTSFSLPAGEISFMWHGGRPCMVRLEKHVSMLPAPPGRPALPGASEDSVPPVHTFEVEDAKNHIV